MRRSGPLRRSPLKRKRAWSRRAPPGRSAKRTRRCQNPACGREFETYAYSEPGKFCSRKCWLEWMRLPEQREKQRRERRGAANPKNRGAGNGRYRDGARAGLKANAVDKERWRSKMASSCEGPGCRKRRGLLNHHVVYDQTVRDEAGDRWDPANSLTLCRACHTAHHQAGAGKLPLSALRDENYAFAFELLGAAAFYYLRRKYAGTDPRLDACFEAAS